MYFDSEDDVVKYARMLERRGYDPCAEVERFGDIQIRAGQDRWRQLWPSDAIRLIRPSRGHFAPPLEAVDIRDEAPSGEPGYARPLPTGRKSQARPERERCGADE